MGVERFRRALVALVQSTVGSRLDYLARYPATVVEQDADGTLHVRPDDARIPGITGVPIHLGVPGARVEVTPGARVLLAFACGDPSKPVAEVWEPGSAIFSVTVEAANSATIKAKNVVVDATSIKLGAGAMLGVARMTDPVQAGPFSGAITAASAKVSSE